MFFDFQLTRPSDLGLLVSGVFSLLDKCCECFLWFVIDGLIIIFLDLAEAILKDLLLRLFSPSGVSRALDRLAAFVSRPTRNRLKDRRSLGTTSASQLWRPEGLPALPIKGRLCEEPL